MFFLSLLMFTTTLSAISVGNTNLIAHGPQNLMVLYGPVHRYCDFQQKGSSLMYVISRSLKFNIMRSPTSRVHGCWVWFASTGWLSCTWPRQSWGSIKEGFNSSTNSVSSRLHILLYWCWPSIKANAIDVVYARVNSNCLQSVHEWIELLYVNSTRGSIVSHWSW